MENRGKGEWKSEQLISWNDDSAFSSGLNKRKEKGISNSHLNNNLQKFSIPTFFSSITVALPVIVITILKVENSSYILFNNSSF